MSHRSRSLLSSWRSLASQWVCDGFKVGLRLMKMAARNVLKAQLVKIPPTEAWSVTHALCEETAPVFVERHDYTTQLDSPIKIINENNFVILILTLPFVPG